MSGFRRGVRLGCASYDAPYSFALGFGPARLASASPPKAVILSAATTHDTGEWRYGHGTMCELPHGGGQAAFLLAPHLATTCAHNEVAVGSHGGDL